MNAMHEIEDGQARLWNGLAGQAWVEAREVLDAMFKPFEDLLFDQACVRRGGRVLDVGCGAGGTTLAVARRLGTSGYLAGIDISAPLIAAARDRAEREGLPARFIRADAQRFEFDPASFDTIISRFGVMFFENATAAFVNLRRAAADGAMLRFVAWRSAAENPFMTTAERAAAALLPELPARRPDEPGQFAFADRDRVSDILKESGWTEIAIRPVDVVCTLPEKQLVPYLTRLGPVGVALEGADAPTRARVIETVRAAFSPYVHGAEVRFIAACWMVSARAADRETPTASGYVLCAKEGSSPGGVHR